MFSMVFDDCDKLDHRHLKLQLSSAGFKTSGSCTDVEGKQVMVTFHKDLSEREQAHVTGIVKKWMGDHKGI